MGSFILVAVLPEFFFFAAWQLCLTIIVIYADTEYTANTRSNKLLFCFVLQSHHNSDVSRTTAAVGVSGMGMGHSCVSVTEDTN